MLRNRSILFSYLAGSTILLSLIGCADRRIDQTRAIMTQSAEILEQNNDIANKNEKITREIKKRVPLGKDKVNAVKAETFSQVAELCSQLGFDEEIVDYFKAESQLYNVEGVKLDNAALQEIKKEVEKQREELEKLQPPVNAAIKALEVSLEKEIERIKRKIPRGYLLDDPIYFNFGDWLVRRDIDKKRLELLAKTFVETKSSILVLQGHADPIGSSEDNQNLSQKRAETVASILVDFGLPKENIRVESYGESRLIVPSAGGSEPDAYKNRRVTFKFDYK